MIIIFIILIIAILAYLLLNNRKKETSISELPQPKSELKSASLDSSKIAIDEIFTDENGDYRLLNKTKEIPRKTYLLGNLTGKYWGQIDPEKEKSYKYSLYYYFHIYEANVNTVTSLNCSCCSPLKHQCTGFHTELEGKFPFLPDSGFPKEQLPQLLPIIVTKDEREYEVNIYEPQLANICFISKLHQTDGKEVFGTIQATITGYMLDFVTEHYTEKVYLQKINPQNSLQSIPQTSQSTKTLIPTGNIEYNNDYQRPELYYSDYKTTYWGDWKYKKSVRSSPSEGCLSPIVSILGASISIVFLMMLLPKISIVLPFILFLLIFRFLPSMVWRWIFGFAGILLVIGCIASIINSISHSSRIYHPKSITNKERKRTSPQYNPIADHVNHRVVKDTLITHYASWNDYEGNKYEGKLWIKQSALVSATAFKNNLNTIGNTENSYNEVVYRLKENDKNNLSGVYQLFDSIRIANNLNEKKFAEAIVSFVQDIPYTVILPNACDGSLYADKFIKQYLASTEARCEGYQRFGINTPVEFMATLNGDCDTRTLLIYTMLSHYDYDVAMLSSEYYNHSVIGINLPYNGIAYTYKTQQYTLWETTAPNIKPGILPNKISNLNYWRITLKSK